jgi:hypothetical protein
MAGRLHAELAVKGEIGAYDLLIAGAEGTKRSFANLEARLAKSKDK